MPQSEISQVIICGIYSVIALSGCSPAWDGTTWDNAAGGGGNLTTHYTYHSTIMNVDIGYSVYLPPQYTSNPSEKFPVLFHFHGRAGDENSDSYFAVNLSGMIKGGTAPMIMVFPNGGKNGKYMDAQPGTPAYGSYQVESTIIHELIPTVDANFRTIGTAASRAIEGFSIGGGGCERFAFKYPQLFSSAYCMAPAIHTGSNIMAGEPTLMANMFNNDPDLFQQNTVWVLSANNATNIRLPLHMIIGSTDSLLSLNQRMDSQLTSLGIPHDPLEVISGIGHNPHALMNAVNNANVTFAASNYH